MKQKKHFSILMVLVMLLALLPILPASADIDYATQFERVTSVSGIKSGLKYLIIGCSGEFGQQDAEYFAIEYVDPLDFNYSLGYRGAVKVVYGEDGIISLDEGIPGKPLALSFVADNKGGYTLMADATYCLNGAYATGTKTNSFSSAYSKSLPLLEKNKIAHISSWTPDFRPNGTVLFKTSRDNSSGYIRLHHKANNGGTAVFSGGELTDTFIDLPEDGSLTNYDLTEDNIPVRTYLFREICNHKDEYLTNYKAKDSTCAEQGNDEYYACSYCGCYLNADKTKEITLEETKWPLAPHSSTVYTEESEATCTKHGNIAYTYCSGCGKYFAGNSTETEIDRNVIYTVTKEHSYSDGVCNVCEAKALTGHFKMDRTTGDGSKYIFASENSGKIYSMGGMTIKGMKAVETEQVGTDIVNISSETVSVAEIVPCEEQTGSYIKIGENYLKNASGVLTLAPDTGSATLWESNWGSNASGIYSYYFYDVASNAQICLVTDDGDPYFSLYNEGSETHIASRVYGEMCSHPNGLVHTEGIAPTCIHNGIMENWYCDLCGNLFSDEAGMDLIEDGNTTLLAHGPIDSDDDGLCDSCSKSMPVYKKVESEDDIVIGGKYIIVSETDPGYYYTIPAPEASKGSNLEDLGTELTPVSISPESDGTFKYNSVSGKKALAIDLDFACEFSDVEEETIRYALKTAVGNKMLNLEAYEGFCLAEYAKYGWRIAMNEDGTVKMADVYDANWEKGNGILSMYRLTSKDGDSRKFFSSMDESSFKTEEDTIVRSFPVYLYRLTESGKVGSTKYTLRDVKSAVSRNDIIFEYEKALNMSNVSGVSRALKKSAVESYVTGTEDLQMNINVNITAVDLTAVDKETGMGGSVTYSLNPVLTVKTASDSVGTDYDITNDMLDGTPISVTLYAGEVYPQQIVHIKHDGTKEYFYPEWSEEVWENGKSAFYQSYDANRRMYVSFEITEFSEIKLLDTPEIPGCSIAGYDEKERSVTLIFDEDGEYSVGFADYEKEMLNGVSVSKQPYKAGTVTVYIPKEVNLSSGDKIFIWENTENMRPLCKAYTI